MDEFIVKQINKNCAKYLVFGTSVESPLFLLDEIARRVSHESGTKVIFDQLLQTGNGDNRFLEISIDNGKFDLSTVKHIDSMTVDNEVKVEIAEFLRTNESILKYSILLTSQKEVIANGGVV
ncbi:MAG: type II toxin-antitoxin system RnlB family antitoxin [Clostridiales bacterium]|jgi:hypothetical protein|nr:type II toxin-antitoxin system RnlB family antitoxin [Clostridiales bacterium]